MTDLAHAQSSDMTVVSRVLIAAMFCGSVVSIIVLNRDMFHLDVDIFWGSTDLEQGLRSVYRLSCGYLGFHAIMFWMIRNPVAGQMTP
ncbi:MAG: hypothetical protein P8Q87_02850, partial [Candidatus Poseidonia sp.]|nr:hypothetical protein [Poseidonia sp.]